MQSLQIILKSEGARYTIVPRSAKEQQKFLGISNLCYIDFAFFFNHQLNVLTLWTTKSEKQVTKLQKKETTII